MELSGSDLFGINRKLAMPVGGIAFADGVLCSNSSGHVDPDSDGALAALTVRGDDRAFERLITRHKARTYRFIYRYVGNATDAYDILQDTFFAAWRALSSYQNDCPFEFWLRRIALNKCRDRSRREAVRRFINGRARDEQTMKLADPAPQPPAIAEADQELEVLGKQLERLPRALKEALLLTALEGLSYEEAGQLLRVSAKAVETKVYRARARLAELCGRDRRGKT
jgi:RNA polymerase sigma-70 factor (ECF subfamily)